MVSVDVLPLCTVFTQMLPAVSCPFRCQATVELQLSVSASSAQEDSPLPHPAFLRCRDAPELGVSVEEEENSEEECVRNFLAFFDP